MTTPTIENTVFSVVENAEVKAPVIVVVSSMCDEGLRLRTEWRVKYDQVVKEPGDAYQNVFGRGYLPVAAHIAGCPQCKAHLTRKA